MRSFLTTVSIVQVLVGSSLFGKEDWNLYQKKTIKTMSKIPGMCSEEKALLIMTLIKNNKLKSCVEIGVLNGQSLYPIARALQYRHAGRVRGIDAWNRQEALVGFTQNDREHAFWNSFDFASARSNALNMISKYHIHKYCSMVKRPSQKALKLFADESIDFIHFDGNNNEQVVTADVISYFKKVKYGGYILVSNLNWFSMRQVLVFLLERSDIVSPFSRSASYLLVRKNQSRTECANRLSK